MTDATPGRRPPMVAMILMMVRAPFTAASFLPALMAAAWGWQKSDDFSWSRATMAVLGAGIVHLAANALNDYFDWVGSDSVNENVTPFSGGSRERLEGLVERKWFLIAGIVLLVIALGLAAGLVVMDRPLVLLLGLAGALGGILYSARPFNLVGRGLGELTIFICFGPLITLGTGYAIEGIIAWQYALLGLPMGFLVANILWINEFPDLEADARAGKRTLIVRLGTTKARWGYLVLVAGFVGSVVGLWLAGIITVWSLMCLVTLILAVKAARHLWANHSDPKGLIPSQAATIQMQAAAGVLLTVAFVVERWLG